MEQLLNLLMYLAASIIAVTVFGTVYAIVAAKRCSGSRNIYTDNEKHKRGVIARCAKG